jgi:hypothetical protein
VLPFLNGSRDGFHGPAGEKTAIRSSLVGQGRASIAPAMLSASASWAPGEAAAALELAHYFDWPEKLPLALALMATAFAKGWPIGPSSVKRFCQKTQQTLRREL